MGSDFDFSLTQAANEAGVHRSTVLRKINAGKLSAQKDEVWRMAHRSRGILPRLSQTRCPAA